MNKLFKLTEGPQASKQSSRRGHEPAWVVVHYSGVANASAISIAKAMSRENATTSAHYVVDQQRIIQVLPEAVSAWHVAGGKPDTKYAGFTHAVHWHRQADPSGGFLGNRNSIGVELCVKKISMSHSVYDTDWVFPDEELDLAARLIADICERNGIAVGHVLRHYDATGKPCPRPFVRMRTDKDDANERLWDLFLTKIRSYLNVLQRAKDADA